MGTSFNGMFHQQGESYELLNGHSPNRYHLMRLLRKKGMLEYGEVLTTLLGDASPSTTASKAIEQVTGIATPGTNSMGGVVASATVEQMGLTMNSDKDDAAANTSRAVSASDVTLMQSEVHGGDSSQRAPTNGSATITYPADASGNGGGGKL